MNMKQRLPLLCLMILSLLISACQTLPESATSDAQPAPSLVSDAEKDGQFEIAARAYLEKAENSDDTLASRYYLRAGYAFWKAGEIEQSWQALAQVNGDTLPVDDFYELRELQAEIALADNNARDAIKALSDIDLSDLDESGQRRILTLRIAALEQTDDLVDLAMNHIALDELLSGSEREANRKALWEALTSMDAQKLDLFNPGTPPETASGWFALAYAVVAYQNNPEAMEVAIEDWQRSYPNHPADADIYKQALASTSQIPESVNQVAVLLPESGPYAGAAAAVRKGIFAAHYAAGNEVRLRFYDVDAERRNNVVQQYQKAVEDGAELIIGPLDKESVRILANESQLKVPVLALNQLGDDQRIRNLFQFGLAPEHDAVEAARYAKQQGFERALLLSPRGGWGDRVASAFREAWRSEGGVIVNQREYSESENDFSHLLVPLLGLDQSEQRRKTLSSTLQRSLEFEPRRRQDVDFVFMIARPQKARQLMPQLRFHRSGQLPVMATSHAYDGEENPSENIDLDRMLIMDIPWLINPQPQTDRALDSLLAVNADDRGFFLRLAALGADAYRLIPELARLSRNNGETYSGATGELTMNNQGQIRRDMPWGRFREGLLESYNNGS